MRFSRAKPSLSSQSERALSISHGREMSRKQLEQYCGNVSDSESVGADGQLGKISSSQSGEQPVSDVPASVDVVEPVEEQSPAEQLSLGAEQSPEPQKKEDLVEDES